MKLTYIMISAVCIANVDDKKTYSITFEYVEVTNQLWKNALSLLKNQVGNSNKVYKNTNIVCIEVGSYLKKTNVRWVHYTSDTLEDS